jgi:hypothetical protein
VKLNIATVSAGADLESAVASLVGQHVGSLLPEAAAWWQHHCEQQGW